MLQIKLSRIGKKKKPTYRIIILEKSKDPYGKSLEILGSYNPHTKELILKEDRIKYWLSKGAGASDTMHNLLISKGLLLGKKIKGYKLSRKRKKELEEKKGAEKPAEAKEAKQEEKAAETPAKDKPMEEKTVEAPAETQS
ncbi:30S ribosomal protein S16 [Candidatus Falkowbacteria bacterium RBG_13_39_14]|uniref:Small ribosomal subunit protein bS16 n=1 Tax=Candidatus Falkowbacteria bacterium RBG_13_39_14 TaxID=1797985 RepID=A0A1F5S120_9BACT|nr:MAG: 30S ribosomal protein S16 [Candidatus Falkowbacteria bacterium RBG_13_39_14]